MSVAPDLTLGKALALAALAWAAGACRSLQPEIDEDPIDPSDGDAPDPQADWAGRTCPYECEPCAMNESCFEECRRVDGCDDGAECGILAECVRGFAWDEQSCACVPDPARCGEPDACDPGERWDDFRCECVVAPLAAPPPEPLETCGSTICAPREICCNTSCGVCTPVGGSCTLELCVALVPQGR